MTFSDGAFGKVWDASTGKLIFTIKEEKYSNGFRMIYSPDGKKLLGMSQFNGSGGIWNAETGQLIARINAHKKLIIDFNFNADGKKIITTSEDSTAKVWNAETGDLIYTLKEPGRRYKGQRFSPDGSRLFLRLSERINGSIITKMWNAETGEYITELNQEGSTPDLFRSPIFFTVGQKNSF